MTTTLETVNQSPAIRYADYSDSAIKYARQSKASNTQTAYKSLRKAFVRWCVGRGLDSLPATVKTIVDYIAYLADSDYSLAYINSSLSAIKFAHELAGHTSPTLSPDVSIVFAGIKRAFADDPKSHKVVKKAAIELDDLQALIDVLPDNLTGKRDKALLLIGFAGAFRRSELVAIDADNVKVTRAKVVITLPKSKTDQEGKGTTKVVPTLENVDLCPVTALRDWLNTSGIKSGCIFRQIDQWGHVRDTGLTGQSVALIIKRYATLAGLNASRFAGHSLRRGLVNAALENGATTTDIRQVTKHQTESAFNEYVEQNGNASVRAIKAAFGEAIA